MRHFKSRVTMVVAFSLAGLVLLLNAMAACPALHEMIHKDADSAVHQCAVTLFAHGQVDSTPVEIAAVAQPALIEVARQITGSRFVPAFENLSAERAPPVAVSSLL